MAENGGTELETETHEMIGKIEDISTSSSGASNESNEQTTWQDGLPPVFRFLATETYESSQVSLTAMIFTERLMLYGTKNSSRSSNFSESKSYLGSCRKFPLTSAVYKTCNILSKNKLLRLERQIEIGIRCKNKVLLAKTDMKGSCHERK